MNEVDPLSVYDVLLWAEKGKSPLQQMTTQQRQAVFSALAIIVLLGIVMIFLVSVSARMVRRYVRQSSDRMPPLDAQARADDWAKKRLIEGNDFREDD